MNKMITMIVNHRDPGRDPSSTNYMISNHWKPESIKLLTM